MVYYLIPFKEQKKQHTFFAVSKNQELKDGLPQFKHSKQEVLLSCVHAVEEVPVCGLRAGGYTELLGTLSTLQIKSWLTRTP